MIFEDYSKFRSEVNDSLTTFKEDLTGVWGEQVERFVEAIKETIIKGKQIWIVGAGRSKYIAQYFARCLSKYSLRNLYIKVYSDIDSPRFEYKAAPGDLLVIISSSGQFRIHLPPPGMPSKIAIEKKIVVVGISGHRESPLAVETRKRPNISVLIPARKYKHSAEDCFYGECVVLIHGVIKILSEELL